jgi:ElaB/YqjD/DUF883 family membrane-anchored ribosome-binding protein
MATANSNLPGAQPSSAGAASQAKAKVSEMGQQAADMIDDHRGTAAGGLESAANALHDRADSLPGGDKVSSTAHRAADAMGTAADYVRENDLRSMMSDLQRVVKNNPGPALLTAAVLGFLVARTFSRD